MAFNEKEQEIIRWGVENGKSRQEVEKAVALYRTGYAPPETQAAPPPKQSFLGGIKEDFGKRVDTAANAQVKAVEGKQSDASAALQTIGQGAGFVGDIASRGLSAVTPDAVGDIALKGVQKVAQTKPVQDLSAKYQEFKAAHPEAAANAESLGLISTTLLAPGAANVTAKGAINAVGSAAKTTSKALGGITEVGTAGIRAATAKAVDPAAIMQRVARVSKGKQAAFQSQAGESIGQYLVKRGIFGNIDEITTQVYTRFEKSKGEVDKTLASLKGNYKNTAVGSALRELAKRELTVSSPGALSKDAERVTALLKKNSGAGLNMAEINEVKRLYERNVKLDYLKENAPDKIARANNIDTAIRAWQQNQAAQLGFKNIRELNRETMLAKQLVDDLGAEYAGSAGNNAITLTDWVILAGGDPTAVGGFLAKKALSSKGFMSRVAKAFTKQDPIGAPKATMGTPTIDNYLDFLKKTTQPTIDIDTPVKDYIGSVQPGLSIKSSVPAPQTIANELSVNQYRRIKEYLAVKQDGANAPVSANIGMDLQAVLDETGIEKVTLPTKGPAPAPAFTDENSMIQYLQAVIDEYEETL